MVTEHNSDIAFANPTKDFFVYMITRDIDTLPAIAELVDNSIDGALKKRTNGDFHGLKINIIIDKERFIIEDNCGGIDLETAKNYAFKFGRKFDDHRNEKTGLYTGLYGIGMKRSLFKLGEKFRISSKTTTESFEVEVDVNEWMREEPWQFKMDNIIREAHFAEAECGTKIEITNLRIQQSKLFSDKVFIDKLLAFLESCRFNEINNGLVITLNGTEVSPAEITLLEDENISSFKSYIDDDDGEIRMVAGITHKGFPEKAGWYVFCNGRLVLQADKTIVTGWGGKNRAFHPEMAYFRGYVFFESKDLLKLPWNTTKTGVDTTNRLYLLAVENMAKAVKQISSSINRITKAYDVSSIDEIEIIKNAEVVKMDSSYVKNIETPNNFSIANIKGDSENKNVTIRATVPKDKANMARESLNVNTYSDLCKAIFEYYCDMEGI